MTAQVTITKSKEGSHKLQHHNGDHLDEDKTGNLLTITVTLPHCTIIYSDGLTV